MCFLGKTSQKRSFFDILNRKECFLEQKREVLKKSRKSKFAKGVSPWLCQKNRSFSHLCFLGKTSQKKSFFDIPDIKEWFLDQKSEGLKKSKNSNFPTVKILKRNYKEPTFNSCIYLMFALYLLIFLVLIIFIYSNRKKFKK